MIQTERYGHGLVRKIALAILLITAWSAEASEMRASVKPGKVDMSAKELGKIDNMVEELIDNHQIPGAVTIVARRGKVVHFEAQGFADIEQATPIASSSIFRFFSMSKPITSAAVMVLLDDGLIHLDDPIKGYLPEFASMSVKVGDELVPAKNDITIRHLLTHTSGLGYTEIPSPIQETLKEANVFAIENRLSENLEEHVKRLAKLPLSADPGTQWNYGESMGVLGRLIEVVSGNPFRTFLIEKLFRPLGMNDTDFFVPTEKASRLATLYKRSEEGEFSNTNDHIHYGGSYLTKPRLEYGGAGLVGTPADYLHFAQMLLGQGELDGVRVLLPESVKMIMSDQLAPELGDNPIAMGVGVRFGLGGYLKVSIPDGSEPGSVGEYSWGGWASTNFWVDPKEDLAVLVFTQVIQDPGTSNPLQLTPRIREIVYKALNH